MSEANSSFQLTKLPTELRLKIYKLAIEDTIERHLALSTRREPTHLIRQEGYKGALALVHTSRMVRAESAREILSAVEAEFARREAFYYNLYRLSNELFCPGIAESSNPNAPTIEEMADARLKAVVLHALRFMVKRCSSESAVGKT